MPFGGQEWAHLAGLWHDLGKYRPGFQRYLRAATGADAENAHIEGGVGRVSHSTAGALLACERFGTTGRVLAYLIASHHAGLYDWNSDSSSLEARLASEASRTELAEALEPYRVVGAAAGVDGLGGCAAGAALAYIDDRSRHRKHPASRQHICRSSRPLPDCRGAWWVSR